jgi:hypothetical protein
VWWNSQNLDRPIKTRDGSTWHFRVWHGSEEGNYRQRLFFWDEQKKNCGLAEFAADQTLHVSKIKQRMQKIVTDSAYRAQYLRELKFPVEKHY